jgi:hypothetical protein
VPELELPRVGLERWGPRLGTPSIGSSSSLATRAGKFAHHSVRRCFAHLAPVRVPRCSSPRHGLSYRFTLPRQVLAFAMPQTEKMRLTDFCNCMIHDTSTCSNGPTLEVTPTACAALITFAGAKAPPNDSSGCTPDVALPASTHSTTRPSPSDEGAGAGCSWWVSRSRNPSDGAPSRRRCRPCARRKNEPLTLPVAAPDGRSLPTPPEPLPPPLRQKRWVSRPEAPSLDECPLGACFRLHLEREPATELGFCHPNPASDALSLLATMRRS